MGSLPSGHVIESLFYVTQINCNGPFKYLKRKQKIVDLLIVDVNTFAIVRETMFFKLEVEIPGENLDCSQKAIYPVR